MQMQGFEMTPVKTNVDPYRSPSADVTDYRTEPNVEITSTAEENVVVSRFHRYLEGT